MQRIVPYISLIILLFQMVVALPTYGESEVSLYQSARIDLAKGRIDSAKIAIYLGYIQAKRKQDFNAISEGLVLFLEALSHQRDQDEMELLAKKIVQIAKKKKSLFLEGYGKLYLGSVNNANDEFQEAAEAFNEVIQIAHNINDSILQADAYLGLGQVYYSQSSYDVAMINYLKSVEIYKVKNNENGVLNVRYSIATIKMFLRQYNEAELILKEVYDKKRIGGSLENLDNILLNTIITNVKLGDYADLLHYLSEMEVYAQRTGNESLLASCYFAIGMYCQRILETNNTQFVDSLLAIEYNFSSQKEKGVVLPKNMKQRAYYFLEKSIKTAKRNGDDDVIIHTRHLRADMHMKSQRYHSAIEELKIVEEYAKGNSDRYLQQIVLKKQSICYRRLGDLEAACKVLQEQQAVFLDIFNASVIGTVGENEAHMNYINTSFRDSLIQVEKETIAKERIVVHKQEVYFEDNLRVFLWGSLCVVLLLSYWIYKRYRLVLRQNMIIKKQQDELSQQQMELEKKTLQIIESIAYASRIQKALFTSKDILGVKPGKVVLYSQPKEQVSGDFYWGYKEQGFHLVVLSDCTRHGVSGALMTIIGINLFAHIIRKGVRDPQKIVRFLEKGLKYRINRYDGSLKDGMDISLCVFKDEKLSFYGTHQRLYHVRSQNVTEYKGAHVHIGYSVINKIQPIEIPIIKGDFIYLTSDGFVDQIGGEKGRKFFYQPFRDLLRTISKKDCADQEQELGDTFEKWRGDFEQIDDVTVLGIAV